MSIEPMMLSNHFILYWHLLLLLSIFPSIRVFSNESAVLHQVAKVLELQVQQSSSNDYSGLVSFRTDWFDLLVVQGTLKSFSSATVQRHQFFGAQPPLWSNPHIHTWLLEKKKKTPQTILHIQKNKNHKFDHMDLCCQSDVSPFKMLSRFVIGFLPRSKRLWIPWPLSLSTVILEPKNRKSAIASIFLLLFAVMLRDRMPWS